MGASLGGSGSGGRDRRRYRKQRFTEINVTPMVDVMLVLLIIFMVTAPMLTAGVQVDLPKESSQPIKEKDESLTVSIKSDGGIYLNDSKTPMTVDALSAKMKAIAAEKGDMQVVFLKGDKTVDYGQIMHVMSVVNAAGISKIALITDQAEETPSRRGK